MIKSSLFSKVSPKEPIQFIVGRSINTSIMIDGVYHSMYLERKKIMKLTEGVTERFNNFKDAKAFAIKQENQETFKLIEQSITLITFETPIISMRGDEVLEIHLRSGLSLTPEDYDNFIKQIEGTDVYVSREKEPVAPPEPYHHSDYDPDSDNDCRII